MYHTNDLSFLLGSTLAYTIILLPFFNAMDDKNVHITNAISKRWFKQYGQNEFLFKTPLIFTMVMTL